MSTGVASVIPIGAVQAYWNDVALGSPKTQATIRYNKETVQAGLEDSTVNVISYKTKETAEVDITIADLQPAQLRYVYDAATGFDDRSTILADAYSASMAAVIRWKEELKMSGTALIALAQGGFEPGTVTVLKSDLSNAPGGYTLSTDFTATGGSTGRLAAGVIVDGETVITMYNQSATSDVVYAGGKFADFEAPLRLVHKLENGKFLQLYAYRAKKIGASDIAIQMAAEYGGSPITFHLLGDMTQGPGKQLFYWAKET